MRTLARVTKVVPALLLIALAVPTFAAAQATRTWGIGVGTQTSLVGVKVLSAARVNLVDNEIYRFLAGVDINPTSATTRTVLKNNHIHDNGIGVINAPGNNAITNTVATLRYNDIQGN